MNRQPGPNPQVAARRNISSLTHQAWPRIKTLWRQVAGDIPAAIAPAAQRRTAAPMDYSDLTIKLPVIPAAKWPGNVHMYGYLPLSSGAVKVTLSLSPPATSPVWAMTSSDLDSGI